MTKLDRLLSELVDEKRLTLQEGVAIGNAVRDAQCHEYFGQVYGPYNEKAIRELNKDENET